MKERKQTNLGRIGLFDKSPTPTEKIEDNTFAMNELNPPTIYKAEDRHMIRVGIEIPKELDKEIERMAVEQEKKKREVINELLESGLKHRSN